MPGFSWKRHGLIFPIEEISRPVWMHSHAQAPWSRKIGQDMRFFFSTRPPVDVEGQYVSRLAFADYRLSDSFELIRVADEPLISLGNRGAFDEFGTYPLSTIDVGNETWGYYGGWTRARSVPFNVQIGLAVSDDGGETFHRRGRGGPILGPSPFEPFVISGPKIKKFGDLFYLFYIAGKKWISHDERQEPVYNIRVATSHDGLTWHKVNEDIISSEGRREAQASPDVFELNGRYHMVFCHRPEVDFRVPGNSYQLGYAWSLDLLTWHRDDALLNFPVSSDGFDSEMQAYPHYFEWHNRQFIAYLGNEFGRFGFGVAEVEGFVQ